MPGKREARKEYISRFETDVARNQKIKRINQEVKKFAIRFPIP
jgi:hypothetical protein